MQVDIGSNAVLQNFSSIVSSEEIRQLNDRLRQEYPVAASGHASAPGYQGDRALDKAQPHRHRHRNRRSTSVIVQEHFESRCHSRCRSSLSQSRSSAGSRVSHQHYETKPQDCNPPGCLVPSLSPEEVGFRSQVAVGVSQRASVSWMNTSGKTSATNNKTPLPNRVTTSGVTQGLGVYAAGSICAQEGSVELAKVVGRGERLLSGPMATVTSTQQRQEGWSDAARFGRADVSGDAADGAPARAGGSPSKKMPRTKSRSGYRADEGSGSRGGGEGAGKNNNRNEKPVAAAGPKLAQTKIQVGMRLRRWIIINRIGAGSFGETFTAMEVAGPVAEEGSLTVTPENLAILENLPPPEKRNEVCIKVEQENKNVLRLEALALKKVQPCAQVVRYIGSGCTNGMNYLVMEKLGSNLAELRRRSQHGTFNIYTTLKAGISCLTAIRGVHDLGLVHRDVKPSNFVTGMPGTLEHTTCFLIDFGLARRFRRSNGEIRPPRENAGFRGTSRYASVASHHHHELGRVDDVWSLLFMLVEFATGTLPWRKYKEKEDIGRCKEESIGPHLVRNLPREFQPFLAHLQTLSYEDEPDYDLLLTLMHRALERRGYPPNKAVEWELDPSIVDSGIDVGAAPALEAVDKAMQEPSALQHEAGAVNSGIPNRNGNHVDGSAKALRSQPRRVAPEPGLVEKDLQGVSTPMNPASCQQGASSAPGASGGRIKGVSAALHEHPADTPHLHNSGTLRVSEVDIGYTGAGQDSVIGNSVFGGDASIQYEGPRPRIESIDIPGTTAGFAVEGSATDGAPASSDDFDPNEYSPREHLSGIGKRKEAPHPYIQPGTQSAANHHGDLVPAVPPVGAILQRQSSSLHKTATDPQNEQKSRTKKQPGDVHSEDPHSSNQETAQPPPRMAGNTADLDSTYLGGEQRAGQQGKGGKLLPKKSTCDCTVM